MFSQKSTLITRNVLVVFSLLIVLSFCKDKTIEPEPEEELPVDRPTEPLVCAECTYLIELEETFIDGEERGYKAGDTICLRGGGEKFNGNLTFENIIGEVGKPIFIMNCDGQAVIDADYSFGVKFKHSENFKLLGDGVPSVDYGIKITTSKGFYLTMEELTTDFEIAYVEIAGRNPNSIGEGSGFAGIGMKTSPYQYCDLFTDPTRMAWIMDNVIVRNCFIHDCGGEGIYAGHGFYNGRVEADCSDSTWSHSIQHVRIHDNLIQGVGYDGIQLKNADFDVKVYNNTISGYGNAQEAAHNEGLFIGEGTTGQFYNNIVENGTGHGIQFQGMGDVDIYNNFIINSGGNGFYGASGPHAYRKPEGYFRIINNTFVGFGQTDPNSNAFVFFNEDGGEKVLMNNIFVGDEVELLYKKGAVIDTSGNDWQKDISMMGFTSPDKLDFTLNSGSRAVDAGDDGAEEFGVITDYFETTRPQGLHYDVGAFELPQ